jgi:hypothetical protein
MLQSVSAATDLDLISFLKAIPDTRMRRGMRIPAWYLLLVDTSVGPATLADRRISAASLPEV